MVSVFCISWGPYALLSIIGILRHSEVKIIAYSHHFTLYFLMIFQDVPLYLTVFPVQLAKSSIIWNPLIYICMNKSVRQNPLWIKPFLTWILTVPARLPEITSSIFSQPLLLQGTCQYVSSAGPKSSRRSGGHLSSHIFKIQKIS